MSANQTNNYGLHLWEGTDNFQRAEFNEDNRKLDAAIAGKPEVIFGQYVGNCKYDESGSQLIFLGFSPKAVLLIPSTGSITDPSGRRYGGMFAMNSPIHERDPENRWSARMDDSGFEVRNGVDYQLMNLAGTCYFYLAIK